MNEITRKEFFRLLVLVFTSYFFTETKAVAKTTKKPKRIPKVEGVWIRLIVGEEGSVDIWPSKLEMNMNQELMEVTSWNDPGPYKRYVKGLTNADFEVEVLYDHEQDYQRLLYNYFTNSIAHVEFGFEIHHPGVDAIKGNCRLYEIECRAGIDEPMKYTYKFDVVDQSGARPRLKAITEYRGMLE